MTPQQTQNPFSFNARLNQIKPQAPEFILTDFLPIPKRKVTMLSAKGGEGKSFIAIQAGLRLSREGYKVGLWLTEDESPEVRERADLIQARILHDNNPISDNLFIKGSETPPPVITPELIQTIGEAWQGLDLVVIDPLIGFFEGSENDNALAKRFMSVLTAIAVRNNQSILVLHHNTKQDAEGNSTTRGASAFIDAVRVLYVLRYDNKEKKHIIKLEKDNVNAKKFKGREFEVAAIPFDIVYEGPDDVAPTQTTFGGIDDDF